jgi:hypothetical protein
MPPARKKQPGYSTISKAAAARQSKQIGYKDANKVASTENAARIAQNKIYGNKKAKPSPTKGGGRTRAI